MTPVATMILDPTKKPEEGGAVTHGIHWQEKSVRELYDIFVEENGGGMCAQQQIDTIFASALKRTHLSLEPACA